MPRPAADVAAAAAPGGGTPAAGLPGAAGPGPGDEHGHLPARDGPARRLPVDDRPAVPRQRRPVPEIVSLNLGHDMGDGQVFTRPVGDPARLGPARARAARRRAPAGAAAARARRGRAHGGQPAATGTHSGHPHATDQPLGGSRHHAGPRRRPPPRPARELPARPQSPARARPGQPAGPHRAGRRPGRRRPGELGRGQRGAGCCSLAFGTGVLAGGAAVSLARLRHRQRQTRRRGRRIPLPASAPVAEAEQRLNVAAARRAASRRCAACCATWPPRWSPTAQQMPEITALLVQPDLPGGPAGQPGGRAAAARRSRWPAAARAWPGSCGWTTSRPTRPTGSATCCPACSPSAPAAAATCWSTWSTCRSPTVDGPASMTAALLRSAAAELATGQLAGWYDLILVGFPELAALGGRGSCCDSLDAGLDLLAAKAVGPAPPAGRRPGRRRPVPPAGRPRRRGLGADPAGQCRAADVRPAGPAQRPGRRPRRHRRAGSRRRRARQRAPAARHHQPVGRARSAASHRRADLAAPAGGPPASPRTTPTMRR